MMESVSFPTILTRVTEKHGELEISSFKEMFQLIKSLFAVPADCAINLGN